MRPFQRLAAGCLLAAATLTATAQSVDVAGVKYPESITASGSKLELNGAGVRYKAVFKVYAAGLYLTQKATTPDQAYAAPGPKRVQLTMLREIDSSELGKLFTRSVQDNMPGSDMSRLIPGLIRMGEIFAAQKRMVAGDTVSVDWVPGVGTVISARGQPQGEPFKEPEFFNAMLRIWLGNNPADLRLKEALLGAGRTG